MTRNRTITKFLAFLFLLGIVSLVFGGGKSEKSSPNVTKVDAAKPRVAVSILPQSYFVKRIGGDTVSVMVLVGPGQSPHTYEPSPRQLEELSRAKAWILSCTDFEDRLKPKVLSLYPNLNIVDGTQGVKFRKLEAHEHEGENTKEHQQEGQKGALAAKGQALATPHKEDLERDRHTWLGREPAKILAAHVRDTLIRIQPTQADLYRKNFQSLVDEIDSTFEGLKKDLSPMNGQTVYVFHPAFGYFFDEFGIQQEAVETGGKEPNPKTLAELVKRAKEDKVKVIFVQAQFPSQAAQTLAAQLSAEVLPLDPLAEDWLANIRRMGETLRKAARN
jgi:zinc transport system substrate-binding protein